MLTKLKNIKEALTTSYWFIPSLMSTTASAAALGALSLDAQRSGRSRSGWLAWLDVNTAEGAREVLSTIAGTTITLAGVTFSITVLALSFASSHFGPRLLRSFMRDRPSQMVLGTFVSAFLYSLIVLRTIGAAGDQSVVPHTAVAGALLLGILSMGVLIFFIHHIARAIQVSSIIDAVGRDLDRLVAEFLSQRKAPAARRAECLDRPATRRVVVSSQTGYVQAVAIEELLEACSSADATVELLVSPGDFVGPMFPIATAGANFWSDELAQRVRDAIVIGVERTSEQDLEFPLDQLVEIAVRALSPSLNDPFTAVLCIKRLAASLATLFAQDWPEAQVCAPSRAPLITLLSKTPERLLRRAFDQIVHYGSSNPAIPRQVMKALSYLHRTARPVHAPAVVTYAKELLSRTAASRGAAPPDAELDGLHQEFLRSRDEQRQ